MAYATRIIAVIGICTCSQGIWSPGTPLRLNCSDFRLSQPAEAAGLPALAGSSMLVLLATNISHLYLHEHTYI